MKQTLLLLCTFYASFCFAQAVAYQPGNMQDCKPWPGLGGDYDLTTQIPFILGDQDPTQFSVSFYTGLGNPETATNPIPNPQNYQSLVPAPTPVVIYARVDSSLDSTYAITSFELYSVFFMAYSDTMIHCEGFQVPYLALGEYYSEPGGQGIIYPAGSYITEPTHIYAYGELNGCVLEKDQVITPQYAQLPNPLPALTACDPNGDGITVFNLQEIVPQLTFGVSSNTVEYYNTYADAENGVNAIANTANYQNNTPYSQTIYVKKYDFSCSSIASMDLIAEPCEGSILYGTVHYDANANSCTEGGIALAGFQLLYGNGATQLTAFSDWQGNYYLPGLSNGEGTLTTAESYNSVPLNEQSLNVNIQNEETEYNFCVTPTATVNDASISITPLLNMVPGFQAPYQLQVTNRGNTVMSGEIILTYNSTLIYFTSAPAGVVSSGNTVTAAYTGLQPFESASFNIYFQGYIPPVLNGGDVLDFSAVLTEPDDVPDNNVAMLNQTVVNSYDPNDITVHEGEFITPEQATGYLRYTIRFQNEGTANAQNIRVDGLLDENLDSSTFRPVASSHSMQAVRDGAQVSFIFDGINLPFTDADEPGSHGWLTYEVKPKAGLEPGDSMMASAGIYFDFNQAILTNTVSTTIQEVNSTQQFTRDSFIIYPNPAAGNVTVNITDFTGAAEIYVTDVLGKMVLQQKAVTKTANLDVSQLKSGIYFIKLNARGASATKKLIME